MLEFLNFYKMTWSLFSKVEKSLYDELFAVCLSSYVNIYILNNEEIKLIQII